MDCISTTGKVNQVSLLTHTDKLQKLEELLAKNRHKADIFLPDSDFYRSTVSVDDPERMADSIFNWLGIKHRSLSFHINPDQEQLISYNHTKNTSKVTLGWHCLEDPLICGAAVAHAIIHHLLIARAKISLGDHDEDEALSDLGTIYAGLGILILNSFERKHVLGSLGPQNYAGEFMDYCSQQRIVDAVWEPYILPPVAHEYLGSNTPLNQLKPFIKSRFIRSKAPKKKLTLAFAGFALIVGSIVLMNTRQAKHLSPVMQEKRDSIALLKAEVKQCEDTVSYKQQKWDTSDIFIQRQIDADKTRCTSLKNRYNYEVNNYNSKL